MIKGRLQALSSVRVSLLCENTAGVDGVLAEHGLSWWIEANGKSVLFDLGQGVGLLNNARVLGIDLDVVDAVAISHGHYDHVGGWDKLPAMARNVPLFLHPGALDEKYQRKCGGRVSLVSDERFAQACAIEAADIRRVECPMEIVEGIWLSGEIPRKTDYEDRGGDFFRDKEGDEVDLLLDDQALFFDTAEGLVVILGCSHAGAVNTLRYLMEISGRRIHAVLGGMHLVHASGTRLRRTLEDLEEIDPAFLGANHCTGGVAEAMLAQAFGKRYLRCNAGTCIQFPVGIDYLEED